MAFLTPDKIRTEHGLEIKEKIIPWGAKWPKNSGKFKKGDLYKADRLLSGGTGKAKYVTIHNTDDIREAKGTNDAEQYTRATWPNCNMKDSRVHYFIDETDCWQNLREDEVGWHAGDGRGPGNDSSLAIEIIMDGSGSKADKAAEDRGALLAAILLDRHGLGIDKLKRHKDWSGKYCPAYIIPHWAAFKAKVEAYLKQIQGGTSAAAKPDAKPAAKPAAPETVKPAEELAVGDTIALVQGAKYTNGKSCADFLYKSTLYVRKISGDNITISIYKTGAITGVVNRKYIRKDGKPVAADPTPKKTVDEIAREVIQGKWGSGATRKKKLEAAGYDYDAVQARVNKLLK